MSQQRTSFSAAALTLMILPLLASAEGKRLYGEGYSVYEEETEELDLGITQHKYFDKHECGNTVIEALGYILEGTGYVLAPPSESHRRIRELYGQPISNVLRNANGVYPLSSLLNAIGGEGWDLLVDAQRRMVTYTPTVAQAAQRFTKPK